jgi:hypothetical protein
LRVTGAAAPAHASTPAPTGARDASALNTILALLHEHTRHDLAPYKSSTLPGGS